MYTVTDFPNILNIKNVPEQSEDWSVYCFFDLGAWHGFALPDSSIPSSYGGFTGPFLMTEGKWLSRNLAKLYIYDVRGKKEIDLSQSTDSEFIYYPGFLNQKLHVDSLTIELNLRYISNQTALIQVNILNESSMERQLRIGWTGNLFFDGAIMKTNQEKIVIELGGNESTLNLRFSQKLNSKIDVGLNYKYYKALAEKIIILEPAKSISICMTQSFYANLNEQRSEEILLTEALDNPDKYINENNIRWNGYLKDIFKKQNKWNKDSSYRDIAVKSLLTLINNWKSPIGSLQHDGIVPSYNIGYFNGFWAWDSWKHAAALTSFAPELAKNQIRAMFDYQDKFGMIADCIYSDSTENNWRDTKPPLSAWAVWKVFQSTYDKEFLKELYPKLVKYHEWWYAYRDHDQNGLCEYGSTDGTMIAAKWESGMDNAVRFDDAEMLQNNEYGWSLNQESVDLNSYLYAEKIYLASIAKELGNESYKVKFEDDAKELKIAIQKFMFDEESGFFYDINLLNKDFIKVQSPEGWIPLWTRVAIEEQAKLVKKVMTDTSTFATFIPFPTVSKSHPEFSEGYWRGPVWLDQAYFAIKGLEKYGYEEEADKFTRQIFDHAEGLKNSDLPIRENYNPINGKGLRVNHFSWSAAHLLMLLLDE